MSADMNYITHMSFADYETDYNNLTLTKKQTVTDLELIRCAYTVGLSPYALSPLEVLEWKKSAILGFLNFTDSSGELKIKNLEALESSEKGGLFYTLGMVFAQYHIQKHHSVRYLAHLKSNGIYPTNKTIRTSKGLEKEKKSPDLWGIVDDHISYLIEAKGSSQLGNYLDMKTMKKARSQLESIIHIDFRLGPHLKRRYRGANMTRLIIATLPQKDKTMMQHIVDPEEDEEGVSIIVNGDVMVHQYYMAIIRSLELYSEEIKMIKVNNANFLVFKSPNGYQIGLYDKIYNAFTELPLYKSEDMIIEGIHERVDNELDDLNFELYNEDNVHIGRDGVMVARADFQR